MSVLQQATALRDHIVHARHDQALNAVGVLLVLLSEDSSTGSSGTLSGISGAGSAGDCERCGNPLAEHLYRDRERFCPGYIDATTREIGRVSLSRDAWKAYAEHIADCRECFSYNEFAASGGIQPCPDGQQLRDAAVAS